MYKLGFGRKVFNVLNILFLACFSLLILIPLYHIVLTSLSSDEACLQGGFILYPRSALTLKAYASIMGSGYMNAFINSIKLTVSGVAFSMVMTLIMAYALAQKDLLGRKYIMMLIIATMLLDGGLIPYYMTVRMFGMINSYSALIIPSAISTYNLLLAKNYFQSIPDSLKESARLDGCSEIRILFKIILPVSIPIIAAITLFYTVSYWNKYFDVVLFITKNSKFTIQVLLRQLIIEGTTVVKNATRYDNFKLAVMMMAILPVLIIYPFIQKYFISGIMLGSIKE